MNILLIVPCLSTSDRYGKALGRVGSKTEPLGLAYLAAAIKQKRNDHIEILDMIAMNYSQEDLVNHLKKQSWEVIGVFMLTPMYLRAKETMKIIKATLGKEIKIIVGGPHPTIFPVSTLEENPEADLAVIGEGEITLVEILDAIENKKPLSKIKGIAYRDKGKVKTTQRREFVKDLDKLPFPARDLLQMKKYVPAPTYYRKLPSYVILTSRGCPYRCTYCSKITGNLYRHHSIERIIAEMRILIEEYGAKEIIFRDDTFGIKRQHAIKLYREIIKQGLNKKIKWNCMTRVNLVDPDLLKLMSKAGCWSIHYGIESGSQRLLDLIQKDTTIKQIKDAIKWTKEAGIETKAFFMLGLPSETSEESLKTIAFAKELDPDWLQFTLTVPYPGTKLYEIVKQEGTLKSLKWEDYQTWAGWSDKELVYVTKGRDQKELKQLQTRAMREFYFRPKFIFKQLSQSIKTPAQFKTNIQGAYALLKSKIKKIESIQE